MRTGFIILIAGIILCAFAENDYRDRLTAAHDADPNIVVVDYSSVTGWIGVLLFITGGIIIMKNSEVTVEKVVKDNPKIIDKKSQKILGIIFFISFLTSVIMRVCFDPEGGQSASNMYARGWWLYPEFIGEVVAFITFALMFMNVEYEYE